MLACWPLYRRLVGPLPDWPPAMVELEPAFGHSAPPAIMLDDEFGRVEQWLPQAAQAEFALLLQGAWQLHGATRIGWVAPARVDYCGAYGPAFYHPLAARAATARQRSAQGHVDAALLCSSHVIDRYFGHWLNDGLLLELLADELGCAKLGARAQPWLHEPAYRQRLALARPRCGRAQRLAVIDDRGVNRGRVRRLVKLRQRLGHASPAAQAPLVFVCRGQSGAERALVNEAQIIAAMNAAGHVVLDPERSTANEIVATLAHARGVISVEGSALAHAVLALPCAAVAIIIQPPQRASLVQKPWFDALGIRVASILAEPRPLGFWLDPRRLVALLDIVH